MSTPSTVEVLRGAKAVIERNGWFQGEYVDRRPEFRGTPLPECPVCLLGAINVASGRVPDAEPGWAGEGSAPEAVLASLLRQSGYWSVSTWNDAPYRTLAEVYTLLDEAIERAEAGEPS